MNNLYKIIHWNYAELMAAKDGFGLIVDPQSMKCNWDSCILGYLNWKNSHYPIDIESEYTECLSFKKFAETDYLAGWHYEEKPSKEVIDSIRYAVYLRHKRNHMDNLSLIEILNKLNEYDQRISR